MAFSDDTMSSPQFVRVNQPSHIHDSANAYDYVVISHADFLAQVAPLATHRQGQGHQTVVVDVDDVYDEFSFGEKTPQALRDFLQWARTNWTTAPRFVVRLRGRVCLRDTSTVSSIITFFVAAGHAEGPPRSNLVNPQVPRDQVVRAKSISRVGDVAVHVHRRSA